MPVKYPLAFSLRICRFSDDGVPSRSVIRSNWCTTFLPGNNGLPVRISAKMHPILQISIAGVLLWRKKNHIIQELGTTLK
ncbi:Os02g0135250 [Oryza sativa Japonica Group]|uniref:Os02g0135250 protein n=1 Tax=Oryza sativa subsp. japonica TaxID=39947 RepID=A0A0P0VEF5_ORYSJ|nr:hypothetical protein EE612_008707 [Oryza sativa]BAS76853.1 Os02g0135250 [Oryza sativa Japonica Group]